MGSPELHLFPTRRAAGSSFFPRTPPCHPAFGAQDRRRCQQIAAQRNLVARSGGCAPRFARPIRALAAACRRIAFCTPIVVSRAACCSGSAFGPAPSSRLCCAIRDAAILTPPLAPYLLTCHSPSPENLMPFSHGLEQWRLHGSMSTSRCSGPDAARYGICTFRCFCLRQSVVKSGTAQSNPDRLRRLSTRPDVCRSGNSPEPVGGPAEGKAFGDGIASRLPDRQVTDGQIRAVVLGVANIIRAVARIAARPEPKGRRIVSGCRLTLAVTPFRRLMTAHTSDWRVSVGLLPVQPRHARQKAVPSA